MAPNMAPNLELCESVVVDGQSITIEHGNCETTLIVVPNRLPVFRPGPDFRPRFRW
jgi:hypothetical protein